jgi:UDP-glucose 4-epimerase
MILVTGGAGYIGSHTCVELLSRGYEVAIVDNFSNSDPAVINAIKEITQKDFVFFEADLRDKQKLEEIFSSCNIDSVIHFAGLKAVGESVAKPLEYYENNIGSTLALCEVMEKHAVRKLIFSSSATVYAADNTMPLEETDALSCTNPYGWSKLMIEQILKDLCASNEAWSVILLRYFNPIGAHKSGKIGEKPSGIPNNLMPYITQVASGKLEKLHVFGNDYSTPDGTGVRDYIHVVDLALGHIKALEYAQSHEGAQAINLGTGKGCSVLELIAAFEKATGATVPYVIDKRRPGDIAVCYADTEKAKQLLDWQAQFGIEKMCKDSWFFESNRV